MINNKDQNLPEFENPAPDKTYARFDEYFQKYINEGYAPSKAQTLAWERCESMHGTGPVVKL